MRDPRLLIHQIGICLWSRSGASFEVAAFLEVVDEIAHRLLGDLRALGQVGQTRAVSVDVLEDGGVGGAEVIEAGFGKSNA